MKKALLALVAVVVAVASVAGFLAFRGHAAAAAPSPQLKYGAQLTAAQCGGGAPVVDVTFKVLNDADSSVTGQNWAMDNFNKHVQVWQTGANSFCAIVTYNGDFTTLASNSPQDTDPSIPAGITGTSHGGYYALFTGALNPSPAKPAFGNLGVVDLNVASLDWSQVYFGTDNLNLVWWGWIYHTSHNGTWINACAATDAPNYNPACPGNAGDITG